MSFTDDRRMFEYSSFASTTGFRRAPSGSDDERDADEYAIEVLEWCARAVAVRVDGGGESGNEKRGVVCGVGDAGADSETELSVCPFQGCSAPGPVGDVALECAWACAPGPPAVVKPGRSTYDDECAGESTGRGKVHWRTLSLSLDGLGGCDDARVLLVEASAIGLDRGLSRSSFDAVR